MTDFAKARKNMVDCQIHTFGVVNAAILNAFGTLPREKFVPSNVRSVAYSDECAPMGESRFLPEAAAHAKMIQLAEPRPEEKVLDVGGGTGYPAAVLSPLVREVIALEPSAVLLGQAEKMWRDLSLANIRGVCAPLEEGAPAEAPFDLIIVNGAAAEIPAALVRQLSETGRMLLILRKPGLVLGQVTLVKKSDGKNFSSYPLFETGCPYLPGLEPQEKFAF